MQPSVESRGSLTGDDLMLQFRVTSATMNVVEMNTRGSRDDSRMKGRLEGFVGQLECSQLGGAQDRLG
jgi:hypothetical protein